VRFDFGLRSRKKKLEAELYYKIVGDGGAIVAKHQLNTCGRYCTKREHPKL
jgi:hypothetical protein